MVRPLWGCVGFYGFINSAVGTLREGCDSTILLIGVLFIVLEIFSTYVRFVQKIWLNDQQTTKRSFNTMNTLLD